MELKAMFPNLNVMWIRWSDYEITTFDHVEYLVPAEKATPLAYDCAEQAEQLVADALELGRQLRMGTACVPLLQPVTGFWAWSG